jgi:hypothetical protein
MLNQVKREELVLMDNQEDQGDQAKRELLEPMDLMGQMEYQDDQVV